MTHWIASRDFHGGSFSSVSALRKGSSMGLILLVVLILLLVGAVPTWGHSQNWGYGPSGVLGLLLVVVLVLVIMEKIPHSSF
jgi:drug/metabolite transporter superfamily protein YnfA